METWIEHNANLLSGLAALLTVASIFGPLLRRWKPHSGKAAPADPHPATASAPIAKPDGIAVIPFDSLSRDPADAHLADGLSCELISALGRAGYRHIAPRSDSFALRGSGLPISDIARKLGVRFVVHGSVRHDGDRLRVIAEFADAQTGHQLWSKTYERPLARLLEVQEELAQAIAASLGGEAFRAEVLELPPNTRDGTAWGLVHKARHDYLAGSGPAVVREAMTLVREAIRLDPRYALAHALLAQLLVDLVATGAIADGAAETAEALGEIEQATSLARRDPEVLVYAGRVWNELGERGKAAAALRHAMEIAPLDLTACGFLARALAMGDRAEAEEALTILDRISRIAPEHPGRWSWDLFAGMACMNLERTGDALAHFHRATTVAPRFVRGLMCLASALGTGGQAEEARQVLARARSINPDFTVQHFEAYLSLLSGRQPEVVARLVGGLRALGPAPPAAAQASSVQVSG
jgi:adenylate cyclase